MITIRQRETTELAAKQLDEDLRGNTIEKKHEDLFKEGLHILSDDNKPNQGHNKEKECNNKVASPPGLSRHLPLN